MYVSMVSYRTADPYCWYACLSRTLIWWSGKASKKASSVHGRSNFFTGVFQLNERFSKFKRSMVGKWKTTLLKIASSLDSIQNFVRKKNRDFLCVFFLFKCAWWSLKGETAVVLEMKTINKQNKFRYARNGFNFSDLLSYLVESYLLYESTGVFLEDIVTFIKERLKLN